MSESGRVGTTGTREVLAEIWRELLGADEVGPEDSFFALGGRSLAAMKVVVQVRARLGVRIKLADMFKAPVLGDFAALVDARAAEQPPREDAP